MATLLARSQAQWLPQIDPFGVVRFADKSICVSPTETDLLGCLIREFGSLVPRETLLQCLPDRPGEATRNALDLHIMRLRKRIRPIGLAVRTVHRRGYLLEALNGDREWARQRYVQRAHASASRPRAWTQMAHTHLQPAEVAS
jgi:DNA-binding winged helix-turn-helix (wHTH) protein